MPQLSDLTAASAGNLAGTAIAPVTDAAGTPTTVKATLAQLRTVMFAGSTGYTATDPLVVGAITGSGAVAIDDTTNATSTITGSVQTDGGLGVVKALWVGGLANIAGAVTGQSTLVAGGTGNNTVDIKENTITGQGASNANATLWLNYYGYNGGLTQFRDLTVGDGKGAAVISAVGSTKAVTFAGAVTASTTLAVTGGFGCNGTAAQTAYASGGALAAYGAGANGLDSGANMSALHALVVSIRAALVANGIMS